MKFKNWLRLLPWSILLTTLALILLGWLGIARAQEMDQSSPRFLYQQIVYASLAVTFMLLVSVPNYRHFARFSYAIFILLLIALIAVFFFPKINYAHRWIRIGPIGFQPAEFAKIAYVMAMAQYLMYRENYRRLPGIIAPMLLTFIPVLLILKEPDLGMALVFLPLLFIMLFVAGARTRDLILFLLLGLFMLPMLWTQMSREQKSRIVALFEQPSPGSRPSNDAFHLYQAKRVRALGGLWGSALSPPTTDDPSLYRLPEARTDFIFTVLGERFGLPGMALLLALFALLVYRIIQIALATREPYGRLLATGVAALFAIQAIINTAMTVGLLPITGLTLPLVSYGGSNLLAHALAIGLVLNIAIHSDYEISDEPFRYTL